MTIVFVPKNDWEAEKIKEQLKNMGRHDIAVRLKSEYKKRQYDIVEYNVEPNKQNALILDFGMNIVRHGAIDNIVVKKKEFRAVSEYEVKKQPLVKCPQCNEHHHPRSRICPYCGYQYPTNIEKKASEAAILSADEKPRVIDVQDVIYARHTKAGSPDSMRVTYVPTNLMERAISEWICLEHEGYAGQKARRWWNNRSEFDLPPAIIDEALERVGELRKPLQIKVNKKGKYDEITKYLFETEDVQRTN